MKQINYILAGNFFDGSGDAVRRRVLLAVEEGMIKAIDHLGPGAELPAWVADRLVDLSHFTIVPPLVDCSVDLARSSSLTAGECRLNGPLVGGDERGGRQGNVGDGARPPAAGAAWLEELLSRHLHDCHSHGVLAVADGGDLFGLLNGCGALKSAADATAEQLRCLPPAVTGGLVAIRIGAPVFAGVHAPDGNRGQAAAMTGSGPEAPGLAPAGDFLRIFHSPTIEDDPLATAVPASAPSPGPGEQLPARPSGEEPEGEDLAGIIRRKGGRKSVVVANGPQAVAAALAAGCDAIEQGYAMGEENLRRLAAQQVLWIPSLLRAKNALDAARGGGDVCCRFSQRYVAPGKASPGGEALWRRILAAQLAQVGRARELGVKMAVGTGAGSPGILHGEAVVEELKLLTKAGCSLPEIIRYATVNGAEFFNFAHLGLLAPGRPATFLVTRGSAAQLPRKLAYLENIFLRGAPSPAYQKNPQMGSQSA